MTTFAGGCSFAYCCVVKSNSTVLDRFTVCVPNVLRGVLEVVFPNVRSYVKFVFSASSSRGGAVCYSRNTCFNFQT